MNIALDHNTPLSCTCPVCESHAVTEEVQTEHLEYGEGHKAAVIPVMVTVLTCSACGFSFTDDRAERARHDAVCRHLGLMSPQEVRQIRTDLHASQTEFSEVTSLGRASLSRWESGSLLQNHANDKYLFLLSFEENWLRLQSRQQAKAQAEDAIRWGKFQSLSSAELSRVENKARQFSLH